jgi:hypothetical protein
VKSVDAEQEHMANATPAVESAVRPRCQRSHQQKCAGDCANPSLSDHLISSHGFRNAKVLAGAVYLLMTGALTGMIARVKIV